MKKKLTLVSYKLMPTTKKRKAGTAKKEEPTLLRHCINFLFDTWYKMFSCDPIRDANWTDWRVGLSCWAHLAPAIAIWLIGMNIRNCIVYEFVLYIIVPTNGFFADYVNTGRVSMWHMIDRWTGTTQQSLYLEFSLYTHASSTTYHLQYSNYSISNKRGETSYNINDHH